MEDFDGLEELLYGLLASLDALTSRASSTRETVADLRGELTRIGTHQRTAGNLSERVQEIDAAVASAHADVAAAVKDAAAVRAAIGFQPGAGPYSGGDSDPLDLATSAGAVESSLTAMAATAQQALDLAGAAYERAGKVADGFAGLYNDAATRSDWVEEGAAAATDLADKIDSAIAQLTQLPGLFASSRALAREIIGDPGQTATIGAGPPLTPAAAAAARSEAKPKAGKVYDEAATTLVARLGFDPYASRGPLGSAFQPGVHDCLPPGHRNERARHELEAAGLLGAEGSDVRLTFEDHSGYRIKSIDAWVRGSPEDLGTPTELKTLRKTTDLSVNTVGNLLKAARQIAKATNTPGVIIGGHALIDGRSLGLGEKDARSAWAKAVEQANRYGKRLPTKTTMVLHDGSILVCRPTAPTAAGDERRVLSPSEAPPRHLTPDDPAWATEWRTP